MSGAAVAAICTFALAAVVVLVVTAPLRRRSAAEPGEGTGPARSRAAGDRAGGEPLEAARELTDREMRDAELDYRTGKLSEQDYRAIDAELKAQALALLDEAERRGGSETA